MPTISVCTGKSCTGKFSAYILMRLRADKAKSDKNDKIAIGVCTCQERCKDGPIMLYEKEFVTKANPVKASEIFLRKLAELDGKPIPRTSTDF